MGWTWKSKWPITFGSIGDWYAVWSWMVRSFYLRQWRIPANYETKGLYHISRAMYIGELSFISCICRSTARVKSKVFPCLACLTLLLRKVPSFWVLLISLASISTPLGLYTQKLVTSMMSTIMLTRTLVATRMILGTRKWCNHNLKQIGYNSSCIIIPLSELRLLGLRLLHLV
jgi:hypothetical protein